MNLYINISYMKICSFVKISQSIMIVNLCLWGRWKFDLQSALLSANHCLTRDTKYFTWRSLIVGGQYKPDDGRGGDDGRGNISIGPGVSSTYVFLIVPKKKRCWLQFFSGLVTTVIRRSTKLRGYVKVIQANILIKWKTGGDDNNFHYRSWWACGAVE